MIDDRECNDCHESRIDGALSTICADCDYCVELHCRCDWAEALALEAEVDRARGK